MEGLVLMQNGSGGWKHVFLEVVCWF